MSFLDIDERILDLVQIVEFNKSPINDIKEFSKMCDVGLIEGGCCNSENVRVLREFRKHCKILISVGQCAITGGLPAMRNGIPISELLNEAFCDGVTVEKALIPNDEELPVILDRVYPCHEIVKVDAYLPGCPPRADLFYEALLAIKEGRPLNHFSYENFKYD
jgi:NAD-reducing hydrogenase small subunit